MDSYCPYIWTYLCEGCRFNSRTISNKISTIQMQFKQQYIRITTNHFFIVNCLKSIWIDENSKPKSAVWKNWLQLLQLFLQVLTAMFLFFICILVSLFALVVEGNDWIKHKNGVRSKEFWESEFEPQKCTGETSCKCPGANEPISDHVGCKALERLNYLYGGLVCCILVGIFLALSSIIIVMIFIPIRPFTVAVVGP